MKGRIASMIWQSRDTLYLIIRLEEELPLEGTQFIKLTYRGVTRAYTCCNPGPSDTLELFIRLKEGGKMSGLLESARPGEEVEVEGPFTEARIEGERLLLLAGGSGLAAFMSLLRRNELGGGRDIALFVSAHRMVEVGFPGELLRMKNTKVVITLTREKGEFEHGHLSREMVEKHTDLDRTIYICGPRGFSSALKEQFEDRKPHVLSW